MRSFKREVYCYCMNSLVYLFILELGLDYHRRGEKVMSKMKGMMMVEWAYVVHRERQNFSLSRTVHNIIRHVYCLQGLCHFVCVCFFFSRQVFLYWWQWPHYNYNSRTIIIIMWERSKWMYVGKARALASSPTTFYLFSLSKKGKCWMCLLCGACYIYK